MSIRPTTGVGPSASSLTPDTSLRPDGDFAGNAQLRSIAAGNGSISKGTRGDQVRLVQQALIGLGYEMPRWGADGA